MNSIAIVILIAGAIFGSFINVVIYRLPRKESIVFPFSYCPRCKTKIKWYHNIPILGFIMLRGKCDYCKGPISLRYPVVEIICAVSTYLMYVYFGLSTDFFVYTIVSYLMLTIIFIDFEHYLIPDKLLIIIVLVVSINLFYQAPDIFLEKFLSGLIILVILYLFRFLTSIIFKKESFGLGDVKLAAVIGLLLGWTDTLIAIFFGFFIAGIVILLLTVLKKLPKHNYVPFGPYMIMGMLVFALWGETILNWYIGFYK